MDVNYRVVGDFKNTYPPIKVKRKPVKMYSQASWAKLVRKVDENRAKGWSMARIARNMSITMYRVRQALESAGGYIPAERDSNGKVTKKAVFRKATDERVKKVDLDIPPPASTFIDPDELIPQKALPKQTLPKEVLELLELIPQMSDDSAKFWLRQIVSNAPILALV